MPRCDHAAFRVANLDRSIEFYCRVLPARLLSRKQHHDRWRTEIATLRGEGDGGFTLVLLMPRRVRWILAFAHRWIPRQTRSHEHLGFLCDSVDELRAREAAAREAGAPIENPITRLDGKDAWLLEVLDPDRNGVEWICGAVHGEG